MNFVQLLAQAEPMLNPGQTRLAVILLYLASLLFWDSLPVACFRARRKITYSPAIRLVPFFC